jgi:hypothetical protein
MNRREFIRFAGIGAVSLLGGRIFSPDFRFTAGQQAKQGPFVPDAEISITAREKMVQILNGTPTRTWDMKVN